jgi:hypothetical protein
MRSISLDESQLATLTPEEQAAIKGDDFTDDEINALKGIAGSDDDADADADDDSGSDEVVDANGNPVVTETVVTPAEKTAPNTSEQVIEPKTEPKPEPEPEPEPIKAPVYEAKMPEDFKEQIDELAKKETELRDKFKAGDIELEEYDSERESILQQREALNSTRIKAEISAEMSQQSAVQVWQSQIAAMMDRAAKPEAGGIDYRTDTAKQQDLDTFVKLLAEKPENEAKDGPWFLNEAHKRVMALHGITVKPPVTPDLPGKNQVSRTPPIDAAPKTLAQVPGGDGPGDVEGEFAHLDALEGEALESAIAKMSPAQREKFSRGE